MYESANDTLSRIWADPFLIGVDGSSTTICMVQVHIQVLYKNTNTKRERLFYADYT